jgi:hypothetical protein
MQPTPSDAKVVARSPLSGGLTRQCANTLMANLQPTVLTETESPSVTNALLPMGPLMSHGRSFTLRAALVGLFFGFFICVSNIYFGLQLGYINQISGASSLLGFALF